VYLNETFVIMFYLKVCVCVCIYIYYFQLVHLGASDRVWWSFNSKQILYFASIGAPCVIIELLNTFSFTIAVLMVNWY
jgi:hypothetical protein